MSDNIRQSESLCQSALFHDYFYQVPAELPQRGMRRTADCASNEGLKTDTSGLPKPTVPSKSAKRIAFLAFQSGHPTH
ncbi:hypothetical protein GGQ68_002330 [Sagittula marina]|uniref:Uncharacterized protein n=1 Tax=Sagittula marina TaxID=943940 RepID=A0A7W6DSA7_9RHOB|nr:hypothetical protein [Sagittula marina]MBB3985992.1 hypothetical protein [Sagittula marina]